MNRYIMIPNTFVIYCYIEEYDKIVILTRIIFNLRNKFKKSLQSVIIHQGHPVPKIWDRVRVEKIRIQTVPSPQWRHLNVRTLIHENYSPKYAGI